MPFGRKTTSSNSRRMSLSITNSKPTRYDMSLPTLRGNKLLTATVTQWKQERESIETDLEMLKSELDVAKQAQRSLEEQKSANTVLKETVDRLRFDLEEIRNSQHADGSSGGSTPYSLGIASGLRAKKGKGGIRTLTSLATEMALGENEGDEASEVPERRIVSLGEELETDTFEEETVITTRRRRVSLFC